MFNNEDIKAYREISAPESLRGRVMASARETKKKPIILSAPIRSIAAIAACFVFAVLVMIPVMTGGGSMLYGVDMMIAEITGIPTRVADNPKECVVIGMGKRLDRIEYYQDGTINLSREREKRK